MDIRHNETEHKFFVNKGVNEYALKYKKLTDKLWNFESTSVPESGDKEENQTLEDIIAYAINFVKERGIKILVSCYDVQDYLIKNRNLKDLVYHPY